MSNALVLAFVSVFFVGCGSPSGTYREQGVCQPPVGASSVAVTRSVSVACDLGGPSLLQSQAALDAAYGTCPDRNRTKDGNAIAPVNFSTEQVIVVSGRDPGDVNFVVDDGTSLRLGLRDVPRGIPFDNRFVVVPRNDHPLLIDRCQEVCVGNCSPRP